MPADKTFITCKAGMTSLSASRTGPPNGGHLLDAHVRPTLEVGVVEASQHLRRTVRGEFGLALLDLSS
jgi:predicted DNA-binding protein with PD1-like motif